jgi:hypothetical protein
MLEGLLKLGGVTALAIGVFYLLYRQLLALRIFARLGAGQTFVIVCLVAVLVWSTAVIALITNDQGLRALIFGSGNTLIQGSTIQK